LREGSWQETVMIPNLYPADELALIRDRIKRLDLR
jgi:hypothetical protein